MAVIQSDHYSNLCKTKWLVNEVQLSACMGDREPAIITRVIITRLLLLWPALLTDTLKSICVFTLIPTTKIIIISTASNTTTIIIIGVKRTTNIVSISALFVFLSQVPVCTCMLRMSIIMHAQSYYACILPEILVSLMTFILKMWSTINEKTNKCDTAADWSSFKTRNFVFVLSRKVIVLAFIPYDTEHVALFRLVSVDTHRTNVSQLVEFKISGVKYWSLCCSMQLHKHENNHIYKSDLRIVFWYVESSLNPMSFPALSDRMYSSTFSEIFENSPTHIPPLQLIRSTTMTVGGNSWLVRFSMYTNKALNSRQTSSCKRLSLHIIMW